MYVSRVRNPEIFNEAIFFNVLDDYGSRGGRLNDIYV